MPRSFYLSGAFAGGVVYVWSCRKPSGYPLGLVCLPADVIRSGAVPRFVTWEVWKMLKRSQFAPPVETGGFVPSRDALSRDFPNLWDFLTQSAWEDGSRRETGSMLIFCDDGVIKTMVKDRDRGLCLWLTAPGLHTLFQVADAGVIDPSADWKKDRAYSASRGKKKGGI